MVKAALRSMPLIIGAKQYFPHALGSVLPRLRRLVTQGLLAEARAASQAKQALHSLVAPAIQPWSFTPS